MPHERTIQRPAFTLIELLVVIAIIAVIISILLPSLAGARAEGRAIKAAAAIRSVGQGVAAYTTERHDMFPPHYVYGADEESTRWKEEDQQETNPTPANGYVHWSWILFEDGFTPDDAFTTSAVTNGGAPRTNPGRNPNDWEPGQANDLGQSCCAELPRDRQVRRMAFTGNHAIFPRNKFNTGTRRRNKLVRGSSIDSSAFGSSGVILAGEFFDNGNSWTSLSDTTQVGGSERLIKSHRPITPFLGKSSGIDVFNEPDRGRIARFEYPPLTAILSPEELRGREDLLGNGSQTTLNAIGRHHPGSTSNFVFVDGHVERLKVIDTVKKRMWGDRFWSITGNNKVDLQSNLGN